MQSNDFKIINDSMLNLLDHIKPETIDSIVTDPPYELNFMNKGWDNAGISFNKDTWKKCYDVLKSGGYLLAFGGSRTFHRIACAIEDAGFEIRDCIMWLYGSGFPKSLNIGKALDRKNGVDNIQHKGQWNFEHGDMQEFWKRKKEYKKEDEKPLETEIAKQWQGWGTALKPAFEPIIVARKPFKGSLVNNVLEFGVGGLNIDECRVEFKGDKWNTQKSGKTSRAYQSEENTTAEGLCVANDKGRFPANLILTYDETDFAEVCGGFPSEKGNSASRYFYCAKASQKDRDEGLNEFEEQRKLGYGYKNKKDPTSRTNEGMFKERETQRKNIHPTVKPTTLMQYLVRLVTPKGGTILDPFMGSGSTGKAVAYENRERNANYRFIGIDLSAEYCNIAKARINYVVNKPKQILQQTIFDILKE